MKLFAQEATKAVILPVLMVLRTQLQVAMLEPKPAGMRSVELRFPKQRVMMAIIRKVAQVLLQAMTLEAERDLIQRLVTTLVQEVTEMARRLTVPATQLPMNCAGLRPMRPTTKVLLAPETMPLS